MERRRFAHLLSGIHLAVITTIATLTFLPNLLQAKIYRDDWYYTMDRLLGGPMTFPYMFAIDRPARGYFFEIYYRLFGIEPLPYHLVSFAAKLVIGIMAYWLFLIIWPRRNQAALVISLLLVIYPGYTRWMEGFEDQPRIMALVCLVASILLTLLAVQSRGLAQKILLWSGSILSGFVYLFLLEFAIGMEVFRWLCLYLLVNRNAMARSWLQKGLATLRSGLPAVLVPGGFLIWRFLIFHNKRAETDLSLQLNTALQSPLEGIASWFIGLVKSIVNTAVTAWASPSLTSFFQMNTAQILRGLLIALFCLGVILLSFSLIKATGFRREDETVLDPHCWYPDAIGMGVIGLVAGVLPVVLANRSVAMGPYSHYSLPASLAVAVLVGGLLYSIRSTIIRNGVFLTLVALAVMTHYSASTQVFIEEQTINNFWHQVVWRAPGIREATGLLVSYPGVNYGEDIDAVSGPANFIYFPQPQSELPVRYSLQAMKFYPWTISEYLAGNKYTMSYRSHYGVIDPGYLLVMSQPTSGACVHILDRRMPWFSFDDPAAVMVIGQNSNIQNILPDAEPPELQPSIFGPEPEHGWCYYFEKADLALQQEDWQRVLELADEIAQHGLQPSEPLEWMPFLQAYARMGDVENFRTITGRLVAGKFEFNLIQTCKVLSSMQAQEPLPQVIQQEIADNVCLQTLSK